ncbi:hypothetical protein M885DRAFT_261235 [Pelagophyceae sp. CCMP2097]|nr:hypothetical protein M885DRAFT_261235 [Pelagophyceae sp. CCMP2097]
MRLLPRSVGFLAKAPRGRVVLVRHRLQKLRRIVRNPWPNSWKFRLKQILKNLAAFVSSFESSELLPARGTWRGESGARLLGSMGRQDKASSRAKRGGSDRHSSGSDPDYAEKVARKDKLKRRDRVDIADALVERRSSPRHERERLVHDLYPKLIAALKDVEFVVSKY